MREELRCPHNMVVTLAATYKGGQQETGIKEPSPDFKPTKERLKKWSNEY